MNKKNIKELREKIDVIDDQLLKLIIERSLVVEKIGKEKDIVNIEFDILGKYVSKMVSENL